MIIVRMENGEVRLVKEQTLAFEERTIEGIKCYVPIGANGFKGRTYTPPENHSYEMAEAYGKFYAYTRDTKGEIHAVYNFETNEYIGLEDGYHHFWWAEISGEKCLFAYDSESLLKGIYSFKDEIWIQETRSEYLKKGGRKLEVKEFLDRTYICLLNEEHIIKDICDFEKRKWIAPRDYESLSLEFTEFQRKPYICIYDRGFPYEFYSFDKERFLVGKRCDYTAELRNVFGNVYVFFTDTEGRVKEIQNIETGDKVSAEWSYVQLDKIEEEIYAYDCDERGLDMRIYNFKEKYWITRHWNHLKAVKIANDTYICDMNAKEEIMAIYKYGEEEWIRTHYHHLVISNDGREAGDLNSQGEVKTRYNLYLWQQRVNYDYD